MRIIEAATQRARATLCIMGLLLIIGLFSRFNMTLEAEPDIPVPVLVVSVFLDGVSPQDADRLLIRPLEQEFRSLTDVKEMSSTARESVAYVVLEFESGTDIDQALLDVRAKVDRARAELPVDAEEPVVEEVSAQGVAAIIITLSGSGATERELFTVAKQLERAIESLPDVFEANLVGVREEVIEILIDPIRLEYYGLTSNDLASAVASNNLLIPAGELDENGGRFSVKVPSLLETREDIFSLPLKSTMDGVITLGDVADVRRTFKDPSRYTTVNGEKAMAIEVEKRNDANSIELSLAVRQVVEEMKAQVPPSIKVGYVFDQSDFTLGMVGEMQGNIVTAMCLVFIVVVATLGFRSGLLVGAGIPFSLLFALIVVYMLGYSFNFMVMFGMLLALGMLIDGSIVITEFADRKMAEGISARSAYQISVKRMFWPVAASTATTLAAFLPLMFWPGVAGKFMSYLPVTVFAVLTGSLLYALFFAPVLGSLFGKGQINSKATEYFSLLEGTQPWKISGLTGKYASLLLVLTRHPLITGGVALATLYFIFKAYGAGNAGVQFFVETEQQYGFVEVRAMGNLSVEQSRDLVQEVERLVLEVPEVAMTYAASGAGANQAGARAPEKDQIGSMWVELHKLETLPRSSREVFEEIRQVVEGIPGIKATAGLLEGGPPVGKPIQIQLESTEPELLIQEARRIRHYLETVEGLRDISDSTPPPGIEWQLKVDRALADQLGVSTVDIGRTVQMVTNGALLGEYRPNDADEEIEIRVRFPESYRGIDALDKLAINTIQGPVTISNFVTRVPEPKVDKVSRVDGDMVMTVKSDVKPGVLADTKLSEIRKWLNENPTEPGVRLVFRGANEEQENSQAFLMVAFSLALFLMFVLLVTQFNSFYQAFLILSAVVMSTAGVLLGLLVTQSVFSTIMTGVGIVALAGIVVNNNIVLIDTYNHIRRSHPEVVAPEAAVMASAQRIRPVFLTTITTILGLMPIAFGISVDLIGRDIITGGALASWWVPLASAIVYGLAFSTVLTLLVTPVMLVIPDILERFFHRKSRIGQPA
ncbi:efflux RND transporter permease subunit [Marinibactrum halimedae]|uniref:Acriflavin resistance protein n=1 Tax=Marinibactrum halimedae TaxID=1444977 RepID=A0AA37T4U8_9GAMM|nr:efflux RND transporter permease subunit [Marinibactrum halimedae]MCD9459902.1 efflux RND transporter permease subunit [Marinibactrum halimedae]GLS25243.1 acriflavin resistance protein [Marinibactrum halimedae]